MPIRHKYLRGWTALTNGSTYRFKIATLAKAKKGSTISAVSDAVSVTPLEGSEDTKESLKIKKEPAENIPSLSSEEKRTKSREEKKSKPAPEIEDMTSSYTLKGVGLSELAKLAFTSFDNFRTKLVVKGYTIRVKSYKADVGKYKATYEVSWEGVPMYILTEKYEANLEDGAQNDSTKMTGEVSMELVEIEN